MPEYTVREFSKFKKRYKEVRKKYSYSFDDDFDKAKMVVKGKLELGIDVRSIPKTVVISRVGADITIPALKTDMWIDEAKSYTGRIIYFVDKENKIIFLVDVYYKQKEDNHNVETIRTAYGEYIQTTVAKPN